MQPWWVLKKSHQMEHVNVINFGLRALEKSLH